MLAAPAPVNQKTKTVRKPENPPAQTARSRTVSQRIFMKTNFATAAALAIAALVVAALLPAPASAQTASPAGAGEIVELDAFVVQTKPDDDKYVAAESITGSRVKANIIDLPFPIQVITSEFMNDFGYDRVDDALAYTSGFTPGEIPAGTTGNRFTRGFAAAYRLVDGFMAISASWDSFIDRVEIIKGPYAAIYGRVQPGGIVNVVSKQPDRHRARQIARLTWGADSFHRAELSSTGPIIKRRLAYRIDIDARERESDLDYWSEKSFNASPAIEWNPTSLTRVTVRGVYTRRKMNYGNTIPYQRPDLPFNTAAPAVQAAVTHFAEDLRFFSTVGPLSHSDREGFGVTLTAEHRLARNSTLRANLTTSHVEQTRATVGGSTYYYIGTDGVPNLGSERGQLYRLPTIQFAETHYFAGQIDWLTRWNIKRTRHQFLLTLDAFTVNDPAIVYNMNSDSLSNPEHNMQRLNPWNPHYFALHYRGNEQLYMRRGQDIDNTVVDYGVFASYRATVLDERLIVSAGFRYDWTKSTLRDYSLAANTTEPRRSQPLRTLTFRPRTPTYNAGVNYGIIKNALVVFASRSTSFNTQAPRNAIANEGAFDNEEGEGIEAGIKSAMLDGKINFTVTVYDIHLKNVRVLNPESTTNGGTDPDASYYTLAGKQRSKGAEIDLNIEISNSLTVFGGLGYVEAIMDNTTVEQNNRQKARVPRTNAGAGVRWRARSGLFRGWSLTGGVRYAGASHYNWNMPNLVVHGYSIVDAGVGYDFSIKRKIHNRVQINIGNLLNHQYITHSGYGGAKRSLQTSWRVNF
jgi:iron complex outermembrane receptor protein